MRTTPLRNSRGFTLTEIMIVVAVIAILAAVVSPKFGGLMPKSRDHKRHADILMLKTALITYGEAKDAYPSTGDQWYSSEPNDNGVTTNGGNWIPGLAPTFLPKLPSDPKGGPTTNVNCAAGEKRSYRYYSGGNDGFKLISNCGIENVATLANDEMKDPQHPTKAIMVCSGASCTVP